MRRESPPSEHELLIGALWVDHYRDDLALAQFAELLPYPTPVAEISRTLAKLRRLGVVQTRAYIASDSLPPEVERLRREYRRSPDIEADLRRRFPVLHETKGRSAVVVVDPSDEPTADAKRGTRLTAIPAARALLDHLHANPQAIVAVSFGRTVAAVVDEVATLKQTRPGYCDALSSVTFIPLVGDLVPAPLPPDPDDNEGRSPLRHSASYLAARLGELLSAKVEKAGLPGALPPPPADASGEQLRQWRDRVLAVFGMYGTWRRLYGANEGLLRQATAVLTSVGSPATYAEQLKARGMLPADAGLPSAFLGDVSAVPLADDHEGHMASALTLSSVLQIEDLQRVARWAREAEDGSRLGNVLVVGPDAAKAPALRAALEASPPLVNRLFVHVDAAVEVLQEAL